jgi:mRNA-degrading endonuclease RelE of RelBE toxin-antitoxin system
MNLKFIYVRYIVTNTDMTHVNNYQYVKKWRENNPELQRLRNKSYRMKIYYYKQVIKELYRICPTLFL